MRARGFGKDFQLHNKSYYYVYNSSMLCTAEFSLKGATLEHFFYFEHINHFL